MGVTKPGKLTPEQRDESVLRALTAVRAGLDVDANPYDRGTQSEQWHIWRFVFNDSADEVRRSKPTVDMAASHKAALDALTSAFAVTVR